jgi:hypothetical protein
MYTEQTPLVQGDGESVPETPPNEEENLKLRPAADTGAAVAVGGEPAFKLHFEVDGVAAVLFVVSVLTRLFRNPCPIPRTWFLKSSWCVYWMGCALEEN